MIYIAALFISIIAHCLFAMDQEPSRMVLTQRRFAVIVPNFNTKQWYRKNLDALFSQQYDNFYIIFIDDGDDGVGYAAQAYAQERGQSHRFILVKNNWRHYKALNLYNVIHLYTDDMDVIAICDGDDWWYGPHVLEYLNDKYQRLGCWLTWGGFIRYPENKIAHQFQVPDHVIEENSFRQNCHLCLGAALRSFEAWLFKQIPLEEFFYEGKILRTTGDMGKMFPMYEMAGNHIWLNDEILYVCNTKNPLSDHRVARHMQADVMKYILNRRPLARLEQRLRAPGRAVEQEHAQLVIIADNNTTPENISAIAERYNDVENLIIIADNPSEALTKAFFVYPTKIIAGQAIADQLKKLVQESDASYYFFVLGNQISLPANPLPLNECIQLLETTKAYAFYIKSAETEGRKFVGEEIFDRYLAWQFCYNRKNFFGNPHALNNTLYRKKEVLQILGQLQAPDVSQLIAQWQGLPLINKTAIGVGIRN